MLLNHTCTCLPSIFFRSFALQDYSQQPTQYDEPMDQDYDGAEDAGL
jgi:hypothetical protein